MGKDSAKDTGLGRMALSDKSCFLCQQVRTQERENEGRCLVQQLSHPHLLSEGLGLSPGSVWHPASC